MSESLAILVCNRKGGAGKTMIATNLAAMFARREWQTVLLDCDSQQSAREWAANRRHDPFLQAVDAHANTGMLAPAIRLRIPPETQCVIYDAPAGASGSDLGDVLRRVHLILIPVMPSSLDLSATESFVEEIARTREVRSGAVRMALIANRIRDGQISTRLLRETLGSWKAPVIGELRDTQLYVFSSGMGKAIHELKSERAAEDRRTWQAIYDQIFRLTGAGGRSGGDGTGEPGSVTFLYR